MYITLHTLKCTTLRVDDRSTTLDDTEKILMTLKSMNYCTFKEMTSHSSQ